MLQLGIELLCYLLEDNSEAGGDAVEQVQACGVVSLNRGKYTTAAHVKETWNNRAAKAG